MDVEEKAGLLDHLKSFSLVKTNLDGGGQIPPVSGHCGIDISLVLEYCVVVGFEKDLHNSISHIFINILQLDCTQVWNYSFFIWLHLFISSPGVKFTDLYSAYKIQLNYISFDVV